MPTRFDEDLAEIQSLGSGGARLDANESIFFARQLEFIRPKIYDIKRPPLSALARFPIDRTVPEWAETITYRMYDGTAVAKIIASYADDLPMVGISGREYASKVKTLGDAYGWSTAEIRAAAATGVPIRSQKAVLAKKGHDITINRIAWFGDVDAGLPGFLTNPNIPIYTVPSDGTGSSKTFASKTPDQIIRDMTGIVNIVRTQSKDVHRATELWMPLDQYTFINSTPRGTYGADSILKTFQTNNPGVTVIPVLELANVPNFANTNVMVAIENSEENLQLVLPMAFKEYPPQPNNLSWKVPCESRIGGVVIEYPFAMAIASGI